MKIKMSEKCKFFTMYNGGRTKATQDLSRTKEEVFIEIPPFAIDEEGNFLNKTAEPILISNGFVDVQEKIQSYKDDVDIYKILEKVALSGDTSLLNRKIGSFADIADLPDNVNDMNEYIKNTTNTEGISDEVLKAAVADSLTSEQMQALIAAEVEKAMAAQNKESEVSE